MKNFSSKLTVFDIHVIMHEVTLLVVGPVEVGLSLVSL